MIKRISESFQAALKYPLVCLLVIIVVRFLTLGFPALTDPSEARYAAIAQQMVVSNHWLVPQINLGAGQEPFWGKPPLHFWLTAISFSIFGFTESAARLPALLAAIGITVLIFAFCRRFFSRETALTALLVMFSSFIFILLSGASMTDMTLTLAITGSLVSFTFATHSHAEKANYWGYAFFLFLAIGMLTKGPIAIVFSSAIVLLWVLTTKRLKDIFSLPLFSGTLLFFGLTVPWFYAAEKASPGLLNYFFINENFLRFVTRNYGDLYGAPHPHFRGAIWLLLFLAMLPWSSLLLRYPVRAWNFLRSSFKNRSENNAGQMLAFLICWVFVPMFFFTFARSILITYVLPVVPALAVVIAIFLEDLKVRHAVTHRVGLAVSLAVSIVLIIVSPYLTEKMSTRNLIQYVRTMPSNTPLFFDEKLPYSAQFYSATEPNHAPLVQLWNPETSRPHGTYVTKRKEKDIPSNILSTSKPATILGKWRLYDLDAKE